ncbi:MAG: hypothetical protein Fur0037_10630 [Planctomycetota bacterium]
MFFKPVKWMLLTCAAVAGAGLLLFGTDFGSYLGTMASSVRESVQKQIPVEMEIKRAERLIQAIDPQIESCKLDVARAEVELDRLRESVALLEQKVAREQKKLEGGARLLSGDVDAAYRLASNDMGRKRVELDLARTLDSFKTNQAILKTKRTLIQRQTEAVAVANQRLDAVRAEKENLIDQVRKLKTQQQWIETMAATSRHSFRLDASALSQAKAALEKVQQRLDVTQKMLEKDMVFYGDEQVAAGTTGRNVLREIQEELGEARPEPVVVESKGLKRR